MAMTMILETVKCGNCGDGKIPVGADNCPSCGHTFAIRWREARKADPNKSSDALALAMKESEEIVAELMDIDRRTRGRSKMLKPKNIRNFVKNRCEGSTPYCSFMQQHVIDMWQATKGVLEAGDREFAKAFRKSRWRR